MITIIGLLLVAGVAAYAIVNPMLRYRHSPWLFDAPNGEEESIRQEQITALDALRDLAMDYRMGQLAEEDYRAMAAPLQQRAKSTLDYQKSHTADHAEFARLDVLLEAEILAARRVLPANGTTRFCTQCGKSIGADFRFCAACGAALPKSAVGQQSASTAGNGANPLPLKATTPALNADAIAPSLSELKHQEKRPTEKPSQSGVKQNGLGEIAGAPTKRSMRRWWVAAGLLAAVWIVGVAWLYISGRSRQEAQVPVTTLADGPVQTLAVANGRALAGVADGLHLSTNGSPWTQSVVDYRFTSLTPLDDEGQTWIGAGEQGLWRSIDGGDQWQPMLTDPAGLLLHTLAAVPNSADSLWGADAQTLYFSHDGGATWYPVTSLPPGRIQTLAVGQTEVYVGTNRGVFLSRDQGLSWTDFNGMVNGRIGSTDIQALAYDEIGNLLFAGTPRGLYFMNLGSPSGWGQRSLNANVTALSLDGANGETLWAGAASGEVFRSSNRGVTWRTN